MNLNLQGETNTDLSLDTARRQIVLREGWLIKQLNNDHPDITALTRESASPNDSWLAARMPAQVHDILLAHGKIADPHFGTNAATCAWIGEKNWAYICRFVTPDFIPGPVFLRFEGLDTLATARLNGVRIGRFENMFREYAVAVTDRLAPAGKTNTLAIVFSSPLRFFRDAKLPTNDPRYPGHKSIRKTHCDFGSYIGARPHSVKVGIYRDVVLDLPGAAWLGDVWVRPELSADYQVATVRVRAVTGGNSEATLRWTLTDPSGQEHSRKSKPIKPSGTHFDITVKQPELWWPRMNGSQPLYTLEVSLHVKRQVLDRRRTTFGIRDVKPVLIDPATGEKRFRFDVNGRPIFLRGGNWVPLEGATHVWQPERAQRLLDLAEQSNVNIFRVWGEGELPPQSFYDECDRRGIFIWQDFMFGYYNHTADDTEFLDNIRAEIENNIRRLRNHPCLLMWCGGNEQYLRSSTENVPAAKRRVFEQIMPASVRRLDPGRLFHTSSPYGGKANGNWPLEGDWHDYTTINFAPEASVPLFGSEVLRTSVPSLSSMKRFIAPEDLWPEDFSPTIRKPGQAAWPPAWAYHSTGIATWDRVGAVHEFCDPSTPEELIRVIGTAHGEYLRDRIERERRGVSNGAADGNRRCWGNIVWRFNDSWPMIYSSVVDYYLEPKIAYYFMRRAYAPVLVSFEKTPDSIKVWVINDSSESVWGKLLVQRLTFNGKQLGKLETDGSVPPGESKLCLNTAPLGEISLRNQFLRATFDGHEASLLLIGERFLHLPPAQLQARRVNDAIEIRTDNFARQVALEFPGTTGSVFEDNFFDLSPGRTRRIGVVYSAGGHQLTIRAVNTELITLDWKR